MWALKWALMREKCIRLERNRRNPRRSWSGECVSVAVIRVLAVAYIMTPPARTVLPLDYTSLMFNHTLPHTHPFIS